MASQHPALVPDLPVELPLLVLLSLSSIVAGIKLKKSFESGINSQTTRILFHPGDDDDASATCFLPNAFA